MHLSPAEKEQIEAGVREIAGNKDEEVPVFLDFESVRVIKPGKYLLDLPKLFSQDKPRVYKLEDGKYVVDLSTRPSLE
jgi:predicted  nucleic acid-binding Zn-ribbon protein